MTEAAPKHHELSGNSGHRLLISDLCDYLESYLSREQIREIYRAYLFSAEAHQNQSRLSGEPYIYHPIAVTRILAGMRMDQACLMAAILHDVIEDTGVSKEEIEAEFSPEVAELVDGVSKLTLMHFQTKAEAQAANMHKMLLAVAKDIRVIIIKLADRLHNMRTLGAMRPDKRRRIARETLDIYAPIANRFGINNIRLELEQLSFSAHWPMRYQVINNRLKRIRGNRREILFHVEDAIKLRLEQEGIECQISGREKHPYSIYRKMRDKRKSINELADVFAFRIVVDKMDTCYRVLGVVHNLYKPKPGCFKDYIAIPKANGYQSLHSILIGPSGLPIEIQIRTTDMHQLAESGIAAHWQYKTNLEQQSLPKGASDWLSSLLEIQGGPGDSLEFLEHVKIDLFPDEVYVFTPKGDIMVLPRGATIIDFAYAVHTGIGNRTVAARVDHSLAPMRTRLSSGQTVEIITKEDATPKPAWLNFVVTGKARAHIRSYLRQMQDREAAELGLRLLEKELNTYQSSLDQIDENTLQAVLDEWQLASREALLADIALGNRMALLVAQRLLDQAGTPLPEADHRDSCGEPLVIRGTEGMVVSFAKCCRAIPWDDIVAVFSPGKGIVVHRQGCPNLGEFRKQGENWMDVRWMDEIEGEFTTEVGVEVGSKRGVLATVAAAFAEMEANIENLVIEERDGLSSTMEFTISVRNRKHLARIIKRLRALPEVMRITRMMG
jgi:GTP pyrophosphokinase